MPRFEIKGDPISITYGVQDSTGIFLSVDDQRLKAETGCSDEVNQVALTLGNRHGYGVYFDLYTGHTGCGIKVSKETIQVYLLRYGIDKKRIDELLNWSSGKPIGSTCCYCYKDGTKTCSNCHKAFYCSRECQVKDWQNHKSNCIKSEIKTDRLVSKEAFTDCVVCFRKTQSSCGKCGTFFCDKECQELMWSKHILFCDALPFPANVPPSEEEFVYGFLLPEDGENAVLVQVPLDMSWDENEEEYFYKPNLESFLGKKVSHSFMPSNLYNQKRIMKDMLIIEFNGNYLTNGSKPNKVVLKMTNGRCKFDWRGPIVIIKAEGTSINAMFSHKTYLNITLADFPNIIDFFTNMHRHNEFIKCHEDEEDYDEEDEEDEDEDDEEDEDDQFLECE